METSQRRCRSKYRRRRRRRRPHPDAQTAMKTAIKMATKTITRAFFKSQWVQSQEPERKGLRRLRVKQMDTVKLTTRESIATVSFYSQSADPVSCYSKVSFVTQLVQLDATYGRQTVSFADGIQFENIYSVDSTTGSSVTVNSYSAISRIAILRRLKRLAALRRIANTQTIL